MSAPGKKENYCIETLRASSGESRSSFEHHQANGNDRLQADDRGRCDDNQQPNSGRSATTWQMQTEQKEACPGSIAGPTLLKCPTASQPQEPGEGNGDEIAAHGNSGDGPNEETLSQVQGESNKHSESDMSCVPGVGGEVRQGKKKHRRRPSKKKRRWKPYFKLSWEEKKALDERETARASRIRAEMFAKGLPVAPYNTTQFLMEEHDREEPDLNTDVSVRRSIGLCRPEDTVSEEDPFEYEDEEDNGSGGGSDGIGRPGNAGGEFLQRDFSETYEKYHVESLQNMTKQELVQEYLELEKCMSRLEEENTRLRLGIDGPNIDDDNPQPVSDSVRLRELESELERLRAQNSELRMQRKTTEDLGRTVATVE